MADTPGKRLYQIRLACGDGARKPETLKKFAARVKAKAKVVYHTNALSLLERDEQGWKIEDARILARVDPRRRGAVWLSTLADDEQAAAPIDHVTVEQERQATRTTPRAGRDVNHGK